MTQTEVAPSGGRRDGPPGVLILGGALGSLGAARSLGRQGIPVFFVSNDNRIPGFSRYVRRAFSWPGPADEGAVAYLAALVQKHDLHGWILLPGSDEDMRFVALRHAELATMFRLATPAWEVSRWAYDKRLTYQRAAELGIPFPCTYSPGSRDAVERGDYRFPLILKPAFREETNAFTLAKAWRVSDRAELLASYDEASALVGCEAIVLQELIPGDGRTQFSYAAIWKDGVPTASLVARRTRQYPADFGYTSTCVETVDEPAVAQAAEVFLRSLHYDGLVEVEFKFDERDRVFKLLDVNGRIWNWMSLGSAAGVDFAAILYRQLTAGSVEASQARTGVSWVHASRDLASIISSPARTQTLPVCLNMMRGPTEYAVFAADDPLPALVELPLVAWRIATRRLPAKLHKFIAAAPRHGDSSEPQGSVAKT